MGCCRAGGQYTHYADSLITLIKISEGLYQIIDLEMFYRSFGGCAVYREGQYAPAGNFWDGEQTQTKPPRTLSGRFHLPSLTSNAFTETLAPHA